MDELINLLSAGTPRTTLTIDEPSRSISYSGELVLGVECDKQAERIYFKIPRTIIMGNDTPVDLKGDNIEIYVNFENALGDTYCTQCVDKPKKTSSTDEDDGTQVLDFSWVITNEVTASKGTVKFSVCVKVLNNSEEITNEWYTIPFEGKILRGINVTDGTTEVVIYPQSSMALLMNKVAEFEASLDDYAGYTKSQTDAKFTALDLKYALQSTVNAIIAPSTAGNAGQFLRSLGSGNKPVWETLTDTMIASTYNGVSVSLRTHLATISNSINELPTKKYVDDAVKSIVVGTLNITTSDVTHNGDILDEFLMSLDAYAKNSISDVELIDNRLTFIDNTKVEHNIDLTTANITHENTMLYSLIEVLKTDINVSVYKASVSNGTIKLYKNSGVTEQVSLNLTSEHITHDGEKLNHVINNIKPLSDLRGWKPCTELNSLIGSLFNNDLTYTFDSSKLGASSGYFMFKFKLNYLDSYITDKYIYYIGCVDLDVPKINDSTTSSYLKGGTSFVLDEENTSYTAYNVVESLLKVECKYKNYNITTTISFWKNERGLRDVLSPETFDGVESVEWQGAWRLDI